MSRKALVIGAAGGVGTQVVKQLLAKGYEVIGSVLDDREAEMARTETPGLSRIIRLDLSNGDKLLGDLKREAFASLDAVIVCAAIGPFGPVEISPLAVFRKTLEINTVATAAVYQACMPALRAAKGRLVFISSFAGKIGLPFVGYYSSSKHALEGLADVMRHECRASGVKIILVEPGGIRTPMVANQIRDVTKERAALSPEQAAQFGAMYDNFLRLVNKSLDSMMDPSLVASAVLEAITSSSPQMRYQVGEDSKFLCEVARKTDAEIDATVAGFMDG